MTGDLLAGVQRLREAGLATIPIKTDGTKRPALSSWKPFEERLPSEVELRRWFGNGKQNGIALIGGKVSGNLEILDFDAPELIAEWRDLVEEHAPGLLDRLPQVETPAGGLHVFFRCSIIEGNKKLAEREVEVPEGTKGARQRDGRWYKVETLIETRGEGGYVITAGSPAACHPTGRLYSLVHGDLEAIPTITAHERDVLLSCARALNEFIKPSQQVAPEREARQSAGLKPGEKFNQRGNVRALLEKYDWKQIGKGRLGEKWQRPDGTHQSATLFDNGNLYVFSSNAYPLEPGCSYSPFAILTHLEHNGDFKAAAKALAGQGYGATLRSKKLQLAGKPQAEVEEAFVVEEDPAVEENASNEIEPSILFDGKLRLVFKRRPANKVSIEATRPDQNEIVHLDSISLFHDKQRADFASRLLQEADLSLDDIKPIEKELRKKAAEFQKLLETEEKAKRTRANEDAQADKAKSNSSVKEVGNVTFDVNERGVWAMEENGSTTWVCSQLIIEADTRDERNTNWGRLLRFPDRDGVWHTWSMPMSLLSRDGGEYREHLLNLGLDIGGPKSRKMLDSYLNVRTDKRALCVTKQGWHRNVFVLPDISIGDEGAEPIYLQTVADNHLFREAGTVQDWLENLGRYCGGNQRLVLAASIAYSAPLLDPLQGENGGWHLTGGTSVGKSTALYVAGSIHGGGGDKGFLRRWRATINGLESVAESHHDSLLCLDEIAECKPDDVNEAAYMLSNGQGKARQMRVGGLRATPEWRVAFLSSGEISLADHVAQTGRRVRGGQEVRIINLPADAGKGFGLFEDLHGFSTADEFSRYLQRTARDFYGAPIRAFLHSIVGRLDELRMQYRLFSDEVLKEMLPKKAVGEVSRVAHRFVLAAFAGELATEIGLTGWESDEATGAAKTLFQVWLADRGTTGSTDEESALRQVRAFLEQHGNSRFQRIRERVDIAGGETVSSEERTVINRAGYVRPSSDGAIDEFFVLPEVFRSEVCKGFDSKMVIKVLETKNLLVTQSGRNQYKLRTPEGTPWTYCIKSEISGV